MIEDKLDIRLLIKTLLFNELSFKFMMKKSEQSYIDILSRKERLLDMSNDK